MEIIKVIPSGFCSGVINAINLTKKARIDNPDSPIYIIGHLVHNHYISDYFKKLNIITLDDKDKSKDALIDMIDDGIVIFSAHGISDKTKSKAINKGLNVIDATCPFVLKTKNIILDYLNNGYEILYVGKNKHPEAQAILNISNHIHLIEKTDDLKSIENYNKIFVTNQTTMSIYEIDDIFKEIKKRFNNAVFSDEICSATKLRQRAILDIEDADVLYVVGDPTSNNSNKLKEIALNKTNKVFLIKSAQDINIDDIFGAKKIYVTSGASTPNYLRDQVIEVLNDYIKKGTFNVPQIDINKII